MPHSQARMPPNLVPQEIKAKPMAAQRKNVNSYFRPTIYEVVREQMKRQVRDRLQYTGLIKADQDMLPQINDSQES